MSRLLSFFRRHWTATLALAYMGWRAASPDARQSPLFAACAALGAVGIALNLLVILANDGMPVRATEEEIPETERAHYRPIDRSTRLAYLGDWIPLGSLLISPGDVLLLVAVAMLVLRPLLG